MIAMLFSAGLGTRLSPLTDTKPKALVEVHKKPLLQHNIERLKQAGITNIVINIHHFSTEIRTFLAAHNNFDINIILSDESDLLLDTGGGLKKASSILKEHDNILLHNVDIITNIDYKELINRHINNKGIATLAVRNRKTTRYLLTNTKNQLIGWKNTKTGEVIITNNFKEPLTEKAFSGIHVVSNKILNHFPNQNQFNIIQWYLKLAKSHPIYTFEHNNGYWFDIGTPAKLNEAEKELK